MNIRQRIKERENAFVALFASTFGEPVTDVVPLLRQEEPDYVLGAFGEKLLQDYEANSPAVNDAIEKRLKGWKAARLSKVSLSILRLAITEMLYGEGGMDSVIINEAVELSKKYGEEKDYQFVNGLLGNVSRSKDGPDATAGDATDPPTEQASENIEC